MARRVAFCGVLSAITVILAYFASFAPTGKFSLYALSSLPVALAIIEFGIGTGLLVYASAILLTFFMTGFFGSLPYTVFFGLYPLLKYYIEKSNKFLLEIVLKVIAFNILLLIYYIVTVKLFSPSIAVLGNKLYLIIIAAQFVFFVYDYVFTRLLYYYQDNIRNRLMKGQFK